MWDKDLAKLAEEWASGCVFSHRSSRNKVGKFNYVGENLYVHSAGANAASVVKSWVDEKKDYSYNSKKCTPGKMCGHYTQVVWSESCAVGCAIAKCSSVRNFAGGRSGYLAVCNYGPG